MKLTLTFALVECSCGRTRQAEQRCEHCGRQGEEVDEDLQRRRTIASSLDLTPRRPNDPPPLELGDLWSVLQGWLDGFMDAFARINEDEPERAAERLQHELDSLSRLRECIESAPKRRPHLAPWRNARRIIDGYDQLVDRYTAALVAARPAAAEAEAQRAQEVLDEATQIIDRFNAITDEWAALDRVDLADEYGDVIAGIRGAFALSGAENLLEFEARGAGLYERIAGNRDCPTGFGIRLQMLDLIVRSSLDEERFWSAAATVYRTLIAAKQPYGLLVRVEHWRRDFVEVAGEWRDAGIEAAEISAPNRRRELRSAVRLGALIAERLAPPLIATLLTVKRRSVYERERAKNLRPLLQEARDAGLADLVAGIDLALRDADAHGEFEIVANGVRFTGTRREYDFLSDDELIDRVLTGFESISALHFGIAAALPEVGVDYDEMEELMSTKPDPTDMVRIALAMNGWDEIEVERKGETVRASGTRTVPTPTGVAASLLPTLEDHVKFLILEGRGTDGVHVARGPVEPFRRGASATNPAERHAASLEALATWTIDGKAPISPTAFRKVIAVTVLEALNPEMEDDEALTTLHALADLTTRLKTQGLARQRDDRRLHDAVGAALRLQQQISVGSPTDVDVVALVGRLTRFAPEKVPALRQSW